MKTSAVFCDDLRVTVPEQHWQDVRESFGPVLDELGAQVEYQAVDRAGWRLEGGTARAQRCGVVWSLSASGQMLAGLRMHNLQNRFLSAIGSTPHTVTGLHATLDREESTSPVLDRLMTQVASDAGLRLSRKRVALHHVDRHLQRLPDGSDTGTIYLGSKGAEIRAAVYDKRRERIARGLLDLGYDLTRYELRLRSGVGATLRDASEPASIFWHFMSPDVLPAPPGGFDAWESRALGVALDWPEPASLVQRLGARIYRSDDVAALLALAGECGEHGFSLLVSLLRQRQGGGFVGGVQGLAPADAASTDS